MALDRVKRGDPITHEWANALVDAINALQITVSPPLQITKSARGGLVLSIAYGFDLTCVCELLEDLAAGGDAEAKILWDKDQAGTWATDADTENDSGLRADRYERRDGRPRAREVRSAVGIVVGLAEGLLSDGTLALPGLLRRRGLHDLFDRLADCRYDDGPERHGTGRRLGDHFHAVAPGPRGERSADSFRYGV
jgi:hypothetical protein